MDDGVPSTIPDPTADVDDNDEPSQDEVDDEERSRPSEPDSDSDSSSSSQKRKSPQNPPLKSRKPPAWIDPSDPPTVSVSSGRLRKLRDAPSETALSGHEYETRLRRQYERINPQPAWAAKARKTQRTKRDNDQDSDGEDADVEELLSSTGGILASSQRKSRTTVLPAGTLSIERLRDANQAAQGSASGEVKVVAFHPSDRVPVLCVGTADRRIRLFNVSNGPSCH